MNTRPGPHARHFAVSLAIHALFVGMTFLLGSHAAKSADPIVVVLTSDPGGGGGGSPQQAQPTTKQALYGPKAPPIHYHALQAPVIARAQFLKDPAITDPTVSPPPHDETAVATAVESAPQQTEASFPAHGTPGNTGNGEGTGTGSGRGHGVGSGTGSGTGTGTGAGSGSGTGDSGGAGLSNGESQETLRGRYLKEHFAYIRDMILGHLVYPSMARKLGWQGHVTVSLLVREDGRVEKTRILRSSGYDALDRNVLNTIDRVQPFPKPPVKAELVIPVAYSLE